MVGSNTGESWILNPPQVQSDADRKADRERRELEGRLTQRIEHLQAKVTSLTSHNSDLSEKKHRAESNVR